MNDLARTLKGTVNTVETSTVDARNKTSVDDLNIEEEKNNGLKYDFSNFCEINKGEMPNGVPKNSVAEDLYDGEIAEIYIGGESVENGENGKESGGNDSILSEMTSSVGPVDDDTGLDFKTTNNNLIRINDGPTGTDVNGTVSDNASDTRKRPLSPNGNADEENVGKKRVKMEHSASANTDSEFNKDVNTEATANELCPPVAVVAPLGFCEDILMNDSSPLKNGKGESDDFKTDICSILDSLEQGDDKETSTFDALFEKMKSEIADDSSFKTLDGNSWTFDENKTLSEGISDDKNRVSSVKSAKPELRRVNSVENDIQDFEKVLNSVIANANRIPKTSDEHDKKPSSAVAVCSLNKSAPNHHQCQQPCTHVTNSDLLRELLDQKTETNDKQTKARQEIDLSFLHSDLVSGKGLSVSSDKILQTRTIDPRMTSIPYIESSKTSSQVKTATVESKSAIPNAARLLENDLISLAEQRRASVTLHHKVPGQSAQITQSRPFSEARSPFDGSNIIKEAFDFATELTGAANDESDSAMAQSGQTVKTESHNLNGFTNGSLSSSQVGGHPANHNFDKTLKIEPPHGHHGLRHSGMQDMPAGNGLLTFANNSGIRSPDHGFPPQLSGPFPDSASAMQNIRNQSVMSQRSAMLSRNETLPTHSHMQQYSSQNPNMMHSNSMKHLGMGQINPMQNSGALQRQNRTFMSQNPADSFTINNGTYGGHMQRNDMTNFRHGTEDKMSTFPYDSGHPMGNMNRNFMNTDNNFSMGMQERIRAMNVQQWYKRRMQAQMNRPANPSAQQMMRHPMVQGQRMSSHPMMQGQGQAMTSHMMSHGQRMASNLNSQGHSSGGVYPMHQRQGMGAAQHGGMVPGVHGIKPDSMQQNQGSYPNSKGQDIDPRVRMMQSQMNQLGNQNSMGNQNMHPNMFSQGRDLMSPEGQGQCQMQYRQQMNQLNRTPDIDLTNSMQMSRPLSTESFLGGPNSAANSQGSLHQPEVFRSQQSSQDMFPFDVL